MNKQELLTDEQTAYEAGKEAFNDWIKDGYDYKKKFPINPFEHAGENLRENWIQGFWNEVDGHDDVPDEVCEYCGCEDHAYAAWVDKDGKILDMDGEEIRCSGCGRITDLVSGYEYITCKVD